MLPKSFGECRCGLRPPGSCRASSVERHGRAAFPRFAAEEGLHVIQTTKKTTRALVSASDAVMTEYRAPEGIERRGTIGSQPRRRHYRPEQGTVEDDRLGSLNLIGKTVAEVIVFCIEETLKLAAREVLS